MFQGIYNGFQKHPKDLDIVLERSWCTGLDKIIITVGTINDVKDAAEIAQKDGMNEVFCIILIYLAYYLNFEWINRSSIFHNGLSSDQMQ